jgi:hypothetical protein
MSTLQLSLYQGAPDSMVRLNLSEAGDRLQNEWFRPRGNRTDSL